MTVHRNGRRKTFLAVGKACVAIFWPTLGFKRRTFVSLGFTTEKTLISAPTVPHKSCHDQIIHDFSSSDTPCPPHREPRDVGEVQRKKRKTSSAPEADPPETTATTGEHSQQQWTSPDHKQSVPWKCPEAWDLHRSKETWPSYICQWRNSQTFIFLSVVIRVAVLVRATNRNAQGHVHAFMTAPYENKW